MLLLEELQTYTDRHYETQNMKLQTITCRSKEKNRTAHDKAQSQQKKFGTEPPYQNHNNRKQLRFNTVLWTVKTQPRTGDFCSLLKSDTHRWVTHSCWAGSKKPASDSEQVAQKKKKKAACKKIGCQFWHTTTMMRHLRTGVDLLPFTKLSFVMKCIHANHEFGKHLR